MSAPSRSRRRKPRSAAARGAAAEPPDHRAAVALTALAGWARVANPPFGPVTGSLSSLGFAGLGAAMMLACAGTSSVSALIRGGNAPRAEANGPAAYPRR